MRSKITLLALAAAVVAATLWTPPASAQDKVSLLDPSRFSFGARLYRSFDEQPGVAGSYNSKWWAGVPMAWQITSSADPTVKLPLSVIGALDLSLPHGDTKATIRGYVGVAMLIKGGPR